MLNIDVVLDELNKNYFNSFTHANHIRTGGSDTYKVMSRNENYFLRIVSDAFEDTFEESIHVHQFLMNQAFHVPKIILNNQGQSFCRVLFKNKEYKFVLYEFIDGYEPEENELLENIGELLGQLHRIMDTYTGELKSRDKEFFIDRYLEVLKIKKYSESKYKKYADYGHDLWEKVKEMPVGYVHGDFHRGNLLKTKEGSLYLLDFDTSSLAPSIFDIMVMCDQTNYFEFDKQGFTKSQKALKAFIIGYRRYSYISDKDLATLYDWIAIRHYQLQATIVEIYGIDCIDEQFLDKQLNWLFFWKEQLTNFQV